MAVSSENKERLQLMNGCEVNSLNYEGCVGINGSQVWLDGEQVDTLDSDEKIQELWAEYVREELGDERY